MRPVEDDAPRLPNPWASWARRWVPLAGIAVLGVTGVGLLHLPAARPLLAKLGLRCPADGVTATQVEQQRQVALSSLRGTRPAATRPALGFELDLLTEADATDWAAAKGLACTARIKGIHSLICPDVPAVLLGEDAALGPAELTLSFDEAGKLSGVDAFRGGLDTVRAAGVAVALRATLEARIGAPDSVSGEPTAEALGAGPLSTAQARFRFTNYLASVQATNLAQSGIAVREQYLSIPNRR